MVPTDVAQANALLDQAGWTQRDKDGIRMKNGKRFSLEYAIYTGAADVDTMVELIRSMWKAIGVEIRGKALRHGSILRARYRTAGFRTAENSTSRASTGVAIRSAILRISTLAPTSRRTVKTSRAGATSASMTTWRISRLLSIQRRASHISMTPSPAVIDQVPTVVLYIRIDNYAFTNALTGFHPNALAPFDDFMNVDIQ